MRDCEQGLHSFGMAELPPGNGPFLSMLANLLFQRTSHKHLFKDAELTEVPLGQAVRTVLADETASDTVRRAIYDECNFQIISLI